MGATNLEERCKYIFHIGHVAAKSIAWLEQLAEQFPLVGECLTLS